MDDSHPFRTGRADWSRMLSGLPAAWDFDGARQALYERDPSLYRVFDNLRVYAEHLAAAGKAVQDRLDAHHRSLNNESCSTCDSLREQWERWLAAADWPAVEETRLTEDDQGAYERGEHPRFWMTRAAKDVYGNRPPREDVPAQWRADYDDVYGWTVALRNQASVRAEGGSK